MANPAIMGLSFVVVVAALGGASRADALTQPVLRLAALVVCGLCFLGLRDKAFGRVAVPAKFLAAFALICLAQLLPLPPGIWSALPGHGDLVEAMRGTGVAVGWRPISLSPDLTLNALLSTLPAAASLLVLAVLPKQRFSQIPLVVLGVIGVSAILGLMQVYGGWPFPYRITNEGNAVGIFANRNHAALLLAMSFPFLAFVVVRNERGVGVDASRAAIGGSIALAVVALLITNGSRAGVVTGAVGILGGMAMVLVSGRRKLPLGRKFAIIAFVCALILLVAGGFWYLNRGLTITRISDTSSADEIRLTALPTVIKMAGHFFPFGAGVGTFEPVFKIFEPDKMISPKYLNHAHNDYLEFAVDTGVFGIALLGAFAWWGLRRAAGLRRVPRSIAIDGWLALVVLVQLAIASAFDYPVRTPIMSVLLSYIAVVLADYDGSASGEQPTNAQSIEP